MEKNQSSFRKWKLIVTNLLLYFKEIDKQQGVKWSNDTMHWIPPEKSFEWKKPFSEYSKVSHDVGGKGLAVAS